MKESWQRVTVNFRDGSFQQFRDIPANAILTVKEGMLKIEQVDRITLIPIDLIKSSVTQLEEED